MSQTSSVSVPVENLPSLEKKIATLNKTAAKLDAEPITLEKSEPFFEEHRVNGVRVQSEFVRITVMGHAPKLNGWTFAARLEHSEGGTVLYQVPGVADDLSQYRTANPDHCDQCGYKRRRKDTYVVMHDDGTVKQVGSNCLKDFLGHQTPQQAARYAQYLIDFAEEVRSGAYNEMREPTLFDATEYLAQVAYEIRERSWVSRKDAWEKFGDQNVSTADTAKRELFDRLRGGRDAVKPEQEDYDLAAKALEWAQNIEVTNDYLHNLHTVLKPGTLRYTQFGIAASAITAFERAQERLAREQAPARSDEYVGAVGDRTEFQVTVRQVFENPSENWGMIHKHIFRDDKGRTLVWPATNGTKLDIGKTYKLQGTVKAHEETKYGKQTVINRCKVVD